MKRPAKPTGYTTSWSFGSSDEILFDGQCRPRRRYERKLCARVNAVDELGHKQSTGSVERDEFSAIIYAISISFLTLSAERTSLARRRRLRHQVRLSRFDVEGS